MWCFATLYSQFQSKTQSYKHLNYPLLRNLSLLQSPAENLSMKSNRVQECGGGVRDKESNRERTKVRCNFLVSQKLPVKCSLVLIGLATQFLNLSQS